MSPAPKNGKQASRRATPRSVARESGLARACRTLVQGGLEGSRLRDQIVEVARAGFHLDVAMLMGADGENRRPTAIAINPERKIEEAITSHAVSFGEEALTSQKDLEFRLSFRVGSRAGFYHGLAFPIGSSLSRAALLVLREAPFAEAEQEEIRSYAEFVRLKMENAELISFSSAQQQRLNQLLEISSELGSTSRLDAFLNKFVVRAAEFMGFERAFVAVMESGECRLRWGAVQGVANRINFELSSGDTRQILETRQPLIIDERQGTRGRTGKPQQYIGVPLLTADGTPLGILGLADRKTDTRIADDDIRRARALASEVSVALEATHNLQLSEQHRRRAENLMEMALDLGSALRLPEFVKNFTARVARIMQAGAAVLTLAQGSKLESVGFFGMELNRESQRKLNAAISEYAEKHADLKITGSGLQALGNEATSGLGWENLTLVRLEGTEGDLLGMLCLANCSKELLPNDLNLLQALIGHASVALENSRLFSRITQSSRQWAEIFDSISDFIVVHDEQYRVLRVNRSLAEFIGVRPAELIGLSMRAMVPITADTTDPCPFCLAANDTDEYMHPVLERTYLASTSRIHGALDEGLQTVHVLKDITDRREAERRYRELFDNVQEGVFFASPEGRFIEVNDALVRMLGYQSREELLKLDLSGQVYVSAQQRVEITNRLNEDGVVRNFEVSLCRRDGSLIHALENAFVVRDGQGKILQYRGVFLDITDVKNFQAQLQRERDFTSKILNNTQTMIMVADTAGLISYANKRCYESGGFDPGLVGNRLDMIIPASHKRNFAEAFESALHGMQVDNLELMVMRSNGAQGKFSVNLSPMREEGGDVTSVVVLMTDITDAAMIQAKLVHTEKMAAVGQLVSGVAHEVNNPLTAIMGFSDLMMENPEMPDSARKDLKVILEEAQRTKEIVQNLLSFARQRPAQRQPMQINNIVRKTIALRAYDFSSHGIQIVENFDEKMPDIVGDSHQLQQVFLNILNNAYDAVRGTGREGIIQIQTCQEDGWVEVLFRDNGEGIKYPERIFDPFFTTKEVGQGTGLGLSICYGIVREHDGEILCANNQDMPGATFCVRLPLQSRAEPKLAAVSGARS